MECTLKFRGKKRGPKLSVDLWVRLIRMVADLWVHMLVTQMRTTLRRCCTTVRGCKRLEQSNALVPRLSINFQSKLHLHTCLAQLLLLRFLIWIALTMC